jgi:hypothetical protein
MYASRSKEWPTTAFINRLFIAGILALSFAALLSFGEILTR